MISIRSYKGAELQVLRRALQWSTCHVRLQNDGSIELSGNVFEGREEEFAVMQKVQVGSLEQCLHMKDVRVRLVLSTEEDHRDRLESIMGSCNTTTLYEMASFMPRQVQDDMKLHIFMRTVEMVVAMAFFQTRSGKRFHAGALVPIRAELREWLYPSVEDMIQLLVEYNKPGLCVI